MLTIVIFLFFTVSIFWILNLMRPELFKNRTPYPKVGNVAFNFKLLNQSKNKESLSNYLGKIVVLYFFPRSDTPG